MELSYNQRHSIRIFHFFTHIILENIPLIAIQIISLFHSDEYRENILVSVSLLFSALSIFILLPKLIYHFVKFSKKSFKLQMTYELEIKSSEIRHNHKYCHVLIADLIAPFLSDYNAVQRVETLSISSNLKKTGIVCLIEISGNGDPDKIDETMTKLTDNRSDSSASFKALLCKLMALSTTSSGWMYVDLILTKPSRDAIELQRLPSFDDDETHKTKISNTMSLDVWTNTASNKISLDMATNASSLTHSTVPTSSMQSVTISDKVSQNVNDKVVEIKHMKRHNQSNHKLSMDSNVNANVIIDLPKQRSRGKSNGTITEGKYRKSAKFGIMIGATSTEHMQLDEYESKYDDVQDESSGSDEDDESSTFSANKEEHGFIEPSDQHVTVGGKLNVTDDGNNYQMFHKETEGNDAMELVFGDDDSSEEEEEDNHKVRRHYKSTDTGEIVYQLPKQNKTKGQWM